MRYANVAFPLSVNQVFTYSVPSRLDAVLQPGVRVLAPFRRTKQEGVVVERTDETDLAPKLIKDVSTCLDETPMFSPEMLTLTKWMADYYVCSWGISLFCAVPAAVRTQKKEQVHLLPEAPAPIGEVQKKIVALLAAEGDLSVNQLARRTGLSPQDVRPRITALREKGVVRLDVEHKPKATTQLTTVAALAVSIVEIEAEIAQLKGITDEDASPSLNRQHAADAKRAEVLQILLEEGTPLAAAALAKQVGASVSILRPLERRGFIQITKAQAVRNPMSAESVAPTQPFPLNPAQSAALAAIQKTLVSHATEPAANRNTPPTFLLHGVTGSGKTEVYMQAMSEVLAQGKSVIVLVPEISLTPQTASRFVGRFGERVALLHSRLSDGERYDQWHRIQKGEADICHRPAFGDLRPCRETRHVDYRRGAFRFL